MVGLEVDCKEDVIAVALEAFDVELRKEKKYRGEGYRGLAVAAAHGRGGEA